MHFPLPRLLPYLRILMKKPQRLLFLITSFPWQSARKDKNARLAARLTGYKIDIKSETQAKDAPGFRYEDYLDDDYDEEDGEYEEEYDGDYEESEDSGEYAGEEAYEEAPLEETFDENLDEASQEELTEDDGENYE